MKEFVATIEVFLVKLTALSLLLSFPAHSQNESQYNEIWRWVRFTTDAGLPSNNVTGIYETTDSTIWVATANGLARYDNFRWIPLESNSGLPQKAPFSIQTDLNDSLLVVVDGHLYRGNQHGFRRLQVDGVTEVVPYSKDALLILARDTLYLYQGGETSRFQPFIGITREKVTRLTRTRSGGIYAASNGDVYRWNPHRWQKLIETNTFTSDLQVFAENIHGSGIFFLRPAYELWEWTNDTPPKVNRNETGSIIRAGDIAHDGDAVYVNDTDELKVRHNGRWFPLTLFRSEEHRYTAARYLSNGDLCIGTARGLLYLKRSSTRWKYVRFGETNISNMVNDILFTRDGSLLLGTGKGLSIISPDESVKTIYEINGMPIGAITGLGEDDKGNIWISSGSRFSGAFQWDGVNWTYYRISTDTNDIFVHRIRKDRRGRLWFLGMNPSPQREPGAYVLEDGLFFHWGTDKGLLHNRVFSFAEDSSGGLWFGTMRGLSRYKDDHWTYWTEQQGILADRAWSVEVDPNNRVWFIDRYFGLSFIDEHDSVRYLTSKQGLISEWTQGIAVDSDGSIWVTTIGGLSHYQNGIWSNFTTKTGTPATYLWPIAIKDSKIYIGSIGKGLAILDTKEKIDPVPRIQLDKPIVEERSAFCRWQAFSFKGQEAQEEIQVRFRLTNQPWSAWTTAR